jgi:hypothetical protein
VSVNCSLLKYSSTSLELNIQQAILSDLATNAAKTANASELDRVVKAISTGAQYSNSDGVESHDAALTPMVSALTISVNEGAHLDTVLIEY